MRCVDWKQENKIKWEKDPETGSVKKVYFIVHTKKCSNAPNTLKLEEEDKCEELEGDCELLTDEEGTEAEEVSTPEDKEEETSWGDIRETFARYMKGIILKS